MKKRFLSLVVFALTILGAAGEEAPTYKDKRFSMEVSAPKTWRLMPANAPREEYAVKEELRESVTKNKTIPIVTVVKPVPGNKQPPASVQIFVVPAQGQSAKVFLWNQSHAVEEAFADFRITREPAESSLGGLQGAQIESTFTTPFSGGRNFPTLSRVWALPIEKMMFVVSVVCAPEDLKAMTADFDLILKSIKLPEHLPDGFLPK